MLPKLLVVEDDDSTRQVIKAGFRKICEIDFAKDGETAVKLAAKTKYPVILMDIALGYGINGIETTNIIRKFPEYKNTPIVALTAFAMLGDKDIFLSHGMTHYLAKPFNITDLQSLIIGILSELNKD